MSEIITVNSCKLRVHLRDGTTFSKEFEGSIYGTYFLDQWSYRHSNGTEDAKEYLEYVEVLKFNTHLYPKKELLKGEIYDITERKYIIKVELRGWWIFKSKYNKIVEVTDELDS